MKTAVLIRNKQTNDDQGTFGVIHVVGTNDTLSLFVTELPWRDNESQMSCIPPGEYICAPYKSPKFGNVYIVLDVPGRGYILFHSGNYAGDTRLGYRTHSKGCILPSLKRGVMNGQLAGLLSKIAISNFFAAFEGEKFKLIVK